MARGVNKVIIIGNLGKDPEVKYLPSGGAVANISVATSESWTDKESKEKQEKTEWHRIILFGKLAEIVGQYLKKGSNVYVEGRLQTRKWRDKTGADRYTTEIVASEMQMLDGRGQEGGSETTGPAAQMAPPRKQAAASPAPDFDDFDDIPFN